MSSKLQYIFLMGESGEWRDGWDRQSILQDDQDQP